MKPIEEWGKALAEWIRLLAQAVNPSVLPFAILCGLVLAGMAVSFFALARAKALAHAAGEQAKAERERGEAALESVREAVNQLAAQLQEVRKQAAVVPAPPKSGFNLSTRSQALRMHRRGEAPDQIASALEIPRQEVDLLLKVHRIVISNL